MTTPDPDRPTPAVRAPDAASPADRPGANDAFLDGLFAAARAAEPAVPDALLARVLADAAAESPVGIRRAQGGARPSPAVAVASAARRPATPGGWLAALVALLGGRGAVAGMAAAGLAGVWIGFAQPVALPFPSLASDAETMELYPAGLDLLDDILADDPLSEG